MVCAWVSLGVEKPHFPEISWNIYYHETALCGMYLVIERNAVGTV